MNIGYLMQAGVPDVRRRPLSGPANHVKQVFHELSKRGHRLRLLALLDRQIWRSDDLELFEPVVLPRVDRRIFRLLERAVRRLQCELHLPYAALFESWRFALASCRELAGADFLYERMGWVGYGGGLAARRMGIPLILEVNGDHLSELEMQGTAPRGAQRWLSTVLMKRAVAMASHTVATGDGWRRLHIERWAASPASVTVVESGSELVSLLDRSQLRCFREDSPPGEITTIAYAGGFQPWQGVTLLLRAVARLVANLSPVRLLLIGSGCGTATAERLVRELGLERHVAFTGQLGGLEYAGALAQADIGVSAYCGRAEYSGLKLLDYKAVGLATVASGKGGEPAVVGDGTSGWIVPPGDEDALYTALVHLVSDVGLRKRLGRAARIEAEQLHGWQRTAERLEELFPQVVQAYHARHI